jgi:hypothetical protein
LVILHRPMRRLGGETVTVTPEPERDDNGDPIEGTAEPFDIVGCAVWPKGTGEDNFRAATTTEDLVLVAPVYETDLAANVTVTRRGVVYRVDGRPAPWIGYDGRIDGTQANLKWGS